MALTRKRRRREQPSGEMILTSLMDLMTIIVVFLLHSFGTQQIALAGDDELVLPVSTSLKEPKRAVAVTVTRKQILVDGQLVATLEDSVDPVTQQPTVVVAAADRVDMKITPLYNQLSEKVAEARGSGAVSDDEAFKGEVLLQCDKRVPFALVRDVMYTAGAAGFSSFRFVVVKGSG